MTVSPVKRAQLWGIWIMREYYTESLKLSEEKARGRRTHIIKGIVCFKEKPGCCSGARAERGSSLSVWEKTEDLSL